MGMESNSTKIIQIIQNVEWNVCIHKHVHKYKGIPPTSWPVATGS